MSHGGVITRPTYFFFIKGSELTEIKPFFMENHMIKSKKSNKRQQKTKLASNLYVENLNHLS